MKLTGKIFIENTERLLIQDKNTIHLSSDIPPLGWNILTPMDFLIFPEAERIYHTS